MKNVAVTVLIMSTNNFADLLQEYCPDDYKAFMEIKKAFGPINVRHFQCVIVKDVEIKKDRFCSSCRRYKPDEGFKKVGRYRMRCTPCDIKAKEVRHAYIR